MKILILVLSYKSFPFDKFLEAQQKTWDDNKHPEIDVLYYHSGRAGDSREVITNCSDGYDMMHWKLKLALDQIDYYSYDLIFRTNSCSYIYKERFLEVCKKLPLSGCYAGYQNGDYISGAGIFFSPDVLQIVHDGLTDTPHPAEDVLIGEILRGRVNMINDNSRVDSAISSIPSYEGYHFRFKTSNDQLGRMNDIDNMHKLHEYFTR